MSGSSSFFHYLAGRLTMHTLLVEQTARALLLERQQQASADNLAARLRAIRRWQRRRDKAERQVRELLLR